MIDRGRRASLGCDPDKFWIGFEAEKSRIRSDLSADLLGDHACAWSILDDTASLVWLGSSDHQISQFWARFCHHTGGFGFREELGEDVHR